MHEFALAEGVISTALEVAKKEGLKRISRIGVAIGELQQIERELFAQAITEIMPEAHPQLAGVDVDLRIEPARFCCRSCGREFGFADAGGELAEEESEAIHFIPELAHTYLRCPACKSPDFEVTKGRGVWIETVEGSE
jgi:hydrogenase nickel incorporation protein HypA/HybF